MGNKPVWLTVSLLMVALLLLSSCGAKAPTTPGTPAAKAPTGPYGTLRVALGDLGAETMNPTASTTAGFMFSLYEPLLRYDEKGSIIPWLAESWSMSANGLLWTLKARKGVKWHNGDEFTAEDIKFSFERYVSPDSKSAWSPMHRQTIERIELPDKYTANVYAKKPYPFYDNTIQGTYVHPKGYFEKAGIESASKNPVGTGPWKLVKYTADVSAELEINKDYWGAKPVWEKLVIYEVPEEATRIAMLKRGEIDIVPVSNDNALKLRSEGFQLRALKAPTITGLFLPGYWMNTNRPLSDIRVREALSIAINRKEIVDSFFKGFGAPGAGNIGLYDAQWGFNPIWYDKYEPDRAKQLLKDAGYPQKFSEPTVKIFSTVQGAYGWEPDLMQVISGYWEAIGVKTQVVPIDFTTMRSRWLAKDAELMGGAVPWIGDVNAGLGMAAQQNHMTIKGVNNSSNDPEVDKLFFDMIAELDEAKRKEKWMVVQQKAHNQFFEIGVVRSFGQYVVSDKVGEWKGLTHLNLMLSLADVQHR